MSLDASIRPDVAEVLAGLKDFQRETVNYVFRRLYEDPDRVSRFLIADEVGLGKTLVARGVIARAVDHLWETIDRIDVVYICSNQDIARQNLDRLNITRDRKFQFTSRATLLPVTLHELRGNRLNFVAFTPGTSFRLRSRSGVVQERWVLYRLLREVWDVHDTTLQNVMRADVRKGNWRRWREWLDARETIDPGLAAAFHEELQARPNIREKYLAIASQIGSRKRKIPPELRGPRNKLIGRLRRLLARSSLTALEPDIVILDEFQRFRSLLEKDNPVALLARDLLDYPNVKVLLLSATPYKMYTLDWEQDEDHYSDFYRIVSFLFGDRGGEVAELEEAIRAYREEFLRIRKGSPPDLTKQKIAIRNILRKVMVRTERLAVSADRNGMLAEIDAGGDKVEPQDLEAFVHLDGIARVLEAGDQVEYWKSSAYPLNLMEEYKLKRRLEDALDRPAHPELAGRLANAQRLLLHWEDVRSYRSIDPSNARLRVLAERTIETGNWKLLWMPASLPYYQPGKAYRNVEGQGLTKSLVFSAWRVVPKVISVLMSYEVERRMLGERKPAFEYSELTRKRRPLLRFALSGGRLVGMPLFCLAYPCLTLARLVDPLELSAAMHGKKRPGIRSIVKAARERVEQLLDEASASVPSVDSDTVDERWYWAALGLLDRHHNAGLVGRWLGTDEEGFEWHEMLKSGPEADTASRFSDHVEAFIGFFDHPQPLGKRPKDLIEVLAHVALAGPAVSTLRALLRVTRPAEDGEIEAAMASAARAGLGFRTLFNQPAAISMIGRQYRKGAYWKKALSYSLDGNLQAVMDEYVHILHESLGLMGHDPGDSAKGIADALDTALSLRSPTLRFDEIVSKGEVFSLRRRGIRCRYALRFGEEKTEDLEGWTRAADLRIAFNSPFRPFVLATTSVGQEGLDFHQYCHRVVHWNLPSNPVDLEQREGRVHRYKGHVIRRNLALSYGFSAVEPRKGELVDPWQQLFEKAARERSPGTGDLVPFWIFEADQGLKIERLVPMLPLSRERGQLERLKRALVVYRSVIGQPRQQELLELISERLEPEEIERLSAQLAIDLSPPKNEEG